MADLAERGAGGGPARGRDVELLDRDEVRAEVDSPTYLGGLWDRDGCAMVDPARLAWGLRAACLAAGRPDLREHAGRRIVPAAAGLRLHTPHGTVDRGAGSRWAPARYGRLLRRLRPFVVPVYDYVLMTEPLIGRAAGRRSAGATGRASATPPTSSTTTA